MLCRIIIDEPVTEDCPNSETNRQLHEQILEQGEAAYFQVCEGGMTCFECAHLERLVVRKVGSANLSDRGADIESGPSTALSSAQ